jgi:hypothetical protein
MATFRSRSEGRGSHREVHLAPPWSDGRSGTFRQESDGKAGSSALDLPDGIILARWNSTLTNLP